VTHAELGLQDALRIAVNRLEQAGVDSPRLAAQVLLAHALNISRTGLAALSPQHLVPALPFQSLVDRCASGEPLAYVIGHKEFYDLDLICDSRALIPRPETELLVETIFNFQLPTTDNQLPITDYRFADIGTGTGCIAVTLAKHLGARGYATDVSPEALALAQCNAERNAVSDRITFLCGDLLGPLPGPVHVVAANLPYVTTPEWEALPGHIRLREPRLALDGGQDGLDLMRRLLAQAPEYVLPGGKLALEIGATQGQAVVDLAQQAFPGARIALKQDYAGLDRLVVIET
jgi:release factor glutamine methyltransferase